MTRASRRKPLLATAILLTLTLLLIGCGKPEHRETKVEPSRKTLTVGQSLQLKAAALDPDGEEIADTLFQWSVEGDSATINDQGLLTARAPGQVKVTATAEKITGTADVTIVRPKVAKIVTTAQPAETTAGDSVEIHVVTQDASGEPLADVEVRAQTSTSGAELNKTSTVTDKSGRASFNLTTATTALTNSVTLAADDRSSTVDIVGHPGPAASIEIAPQEAEVTASKATEILVTVRDRAGNSVPGATVTFTAKTDGTGVDPREATTQATGQVRVNVQTNVKTGQNTIGITAARLPEQSFSFDTRAGAPAKFALEPTMPTTVAGGQIEIAAEVLDAHGNPVSGAAIELATPTEGSSLAATALTTNNEGKAQTAFTTAPEPGVGQIVASMTGLGDVTVSITGNPPTALKVNPENATVEMRGSQEFAAWVTDEDGNRAVVDAQWRVVGNGGSIDDRGIFTSEELGDEAVVANYRDLIGGATLRVVPGVPAAVRVSPDASELISGQNQQFSASVFNAHEYPLNDKVQWSVSQGVGTIDAGGLFTATKAGAGTVNATAGDATAQANITVTPGPLATVQVEPNRLAIRAGEETTLKAQGLDAGGNSVPLEPTWSLTADLGVIDQTGQFRAEHVGSGTIRVAAGSPPIIAEVPVQVVTAALARIEVEPLSLTVSAGEEHVFRATGFDSSNNVLRVTPAWTLSGDVGKIDAHGKLSAHRTGTASVQAKVDELTATASVTVKPGDLASLEIAPKGPFTLQAGATMTFTLIGKDAFGNAMLVEPKWEQPQPLGVFEGGGQFRATTVGTGPLIVQAGGKKAQVAMTVVHGQLATIDVQPQRPELTAGSTVKFTATGRDAYGNEIPIEASWRLTNQIGEITAAGELTALQAGPGEVIATAGGISGSSGVTVFPDKLTFLKITPLQIDIPAGEEHPIVVVGYDTYGNPVPVHPVWQIPDDLGTIDAKGTFTGRKVGEGRIVVAVGTLAAAIDTRVSLGTPRRLEIVPATTEIQSGDKRAFAVVAFDGGGNEVAVGNAAWELEGGIGTIDPGGNFTASIAGNGKLTAKVDSLEAVMDLTVTPGAAVSLDLIPPAANVAAGQVLTVIPRAVDAAGNEIKRQPQWTATENIGEMFDHGIFKATTTGAGKLVANMDGVSATVAVLVEAGPLARIEITPGKAEMEAGDERGFGATGYDAFGNIRDLYPSWSLQGDIGTLDTIKGVFKATKTGNGYIVASDQFIAGLAPIRVTAGEVTRIEVSPDTINVNAGDKVPFRVEAYDAYGNLAAHDIHWRMSKPLGKMAGNVFLPTKTGQTDLIVAHDYHSATARVEVGIGPIVKLDVMPESFTLEAGKSFGATARGTDEFGNTAAVSATWQVDDNIGVVDAQSGVFTAGQAGHGILTARVGEFTAETRVTTVPGPVQRISIQPETARVASTEQETFTAIGIDAGGNERPVTVQWGVNSQLGNIDANGRFTAKGLGTGPVVAYQDSGLISTAAVTVTPGPVVLMFVTPQPTTVRAGDTSHFEVIGYDANRNPVPNLTADWRTVGRIGEINQSTGAFTGTLVGWGKVQATAGQAVGNADVRVTPGTPSQIKSRITSSRVEIAADGETAADVTVLVRDRFGNPIADVPVTLIARTDDEIQQPQPTNAQGIAVGKIRSSKMGIAEVSAIVGAVRIQQTLRLQFYLRRAAIQKSAAS